MLKPTITFIGAGHMAENLIHGLVANRYPKEYLCATNRSVERLNFIKKQYQISTTQNNEEGARGAEILLLAIKPQNTTEALDSLKVVVKERRPLIISIVTGWTTKNIQKRLECERLPIVRCVPNTPTLVGSGMTALYANHYCTQEQKNITAFILQPISVTLWLEQENLMNAATALSGSGPAYFYTVMEALQQAGIALGLPKEIATQLTLQTAFGAAKMALESHEEIAVLRKQVTSKGGTTEQALNILQEKGLANIFSKAVRAAYEHAITLSKD